LDSDMTRIGIIGTGAWGTALAMVARRAGCRVTIWGYESETVAAINDRHENPVFLPGIRLPPEIRATTDLAVATAADAVLLVTPAQFLRATATGLAGAIPPDCPVVVCAKGIEQQTGALMTEVIADTLPGHPLAVLSGPTFAAEVALGLPTAVTLACTDEDAASLLVTALGGERFRPYVSDDVIGAEIGGAVKNVLAIACGITEGRRLGENARAALITRGLAEMTRLCIAKGGRAETMMGLSGLGDLTLTCASTKSRNYSLGRALGEGEALGDIMATRLSVAEGVHSAAAVVRLAEMLGIDMPISAAVDQILNRGAELDAVIAGLLQRPFRSEH
jgi:glycerol-3-phosphate dehydrogenase (NAD(P)+)